MKCLSFFFNHCIEGILCGLWRMVDYHEIEFMKCLCVCFFLWSHVGLRERGDKETSALIVFVYVLSCLLHAHGRIFFDFLYWCMLK